MFLVPAIRIGFRERNAWIKRIKGVLGDALTLACRWGVAWTTARCRSGRAGPSSVISIHTESHAMESLVDIESDADNNQVADVVFQEGDDWSDSEAVADDGGEMEEEPAGEVFMAAAEFGLVQAGELTGVESNSAVPLPASVWLFGTGLLLLVSSGKRRKT